MRKLVYICQWGKNREKAWSGTYLSLYNALNRYYSLMDYEIYSSFWTQLRTYIYKKWGFFKYDFFYSDIVKFNHSKKAKALCDVCTLQFSELELNESVHSYIYQDMNIHFIKNCILNDENLKNYFRKDVSTAILEKRLRKQAEYYQKCNGIFVMGDWLKQYMINNMHIDASKIHSVGAGYDIDITRRDFSNRESNKILFVGRDFERKGGYLLVEAFKILRSKYQNDAELYIVGPDNNVINEHIDGIHFVGAANSKELVKYYNMCDVFCMPSYLEPFGKVFVEALCYALPVIARDSFAAPEIIDDRQNGRLVKEDNPEKLAEMMYDLLHNDEIKQYVLSHADSYCEKYSWDSVAKRISDEINKDTLMLED